MKILAGRTKKIRKPEVVQKKKRQGKYGYVELIHNKDFKFTYEYLPNDTIFQAEKLDEMCGATCANCTRRLGCQQLKKVKSDTLDYVCRNLNPEIRLKKTAKVTKISNLADMKLEDQKKHYADLFHILLSNVFPSKELYELSLGVK